MGHDPQTLPPSLPEPGDDGACDHLTGVELPSIRLRSTRGGDVDLAQISAGMTVFYVYPRTGVPGVEMPTGWDSIPGARGCTPQSCAYRDDYRAFQTLGVAVYGLSSHSSNAQREFSAREHIPFPLLSDSDLKLRSALALPTFTVDGHQLYRRVTLIVRAAEIVHVRYPVFPPSADSGETLSWIRTNLLLDDPWALRPQTRPRRSADRSNQDSDS